jgi:hypothetical protein
MKAFQLALVLILASSSGLAEVTVKYDKKNDCNLYRVVAKKEVGGEWTFSPGLEEGESVHRRVFLTGMSVSDLEIDFDDRSARGFLEMRMPLHRNKNLVGPKVRISAANKGFTDFINRTNSEINMIHEICLDRNHNVIYFE